MGMEVNLVGQTLGAYRIIEQIGRGGMATVYKAYEPALDRYVAIKILPQYFAHDPDFAVRFEREAKAVARLNHPNILPIYSFGQEAGLSYIAMRYVEAGTLKEMLSQPLDLKTAADILGQIGRALDYAHQRGIVHRDVKPTNVLMAEGKWALLTDFGLARMVESSVQLTKSGVGVGTPAYMSPEQGQGIKVDARSDVYSLGVVLYEMVTGKLPYEAETPMAVVLKHITAPLPLPREVNPDLPEAVERVILKAMAKDPADRYQRAEELVEALERVVAGVPVVERPPEVKPVPVEKVPSATMIAEPAPATAVAVPVEAPPVARKGLPVWVWGVVGALVVLIAAGGVFLATRGGPSPTPAATAALAATPTLLPLDTASPEPLAPVSPGGPPMDAREVRPCDWEGLGPGLCIYPVGGGAPTKILEDAGLETIWASSWSPDGQQLAFSARDPESPDPSITIYIVNADGSGLIKLPSMGNDISPAWSPDGEWLAFQSDGNLAIMHPDGSDPTVIWDGEGDECPVDPQWSPDSQWLAVRVQMEGCEWAFPMTCEVWVISRDGATITTVATITYERSACFDVAFRPDGAQVAYFDADCRPWIVNADGSGQATPLDDFPYWWTSMAYPQWGGEVGAPPAPIPPSPQEPVSPGSPPAERFFHDDFEGEGLDLARWELGGDVVDENIVFIRDGQFRVEFVNDLLIEQGGDLRARLSAPVKSIEFNIGLEEAGGRMLAFGVDFTGAGERKSLWLNEEGSVLIEEKMGQIVDIRRAMYPPVQYNILLKWEGDKIVIHIDGEPVGKMDVQDFAKDVAFWFHLGPGGKVVGYIDDVHLEYAE